MAGPLIFDYIQTRRTKAPSNVTQIVYTRIVRNKQKLKDYLDGYETKFIKKAKPVLKRFELGPDRSRPRDSAAPKNFDSGEKL